MGPFTFVSEAVDINIDEALASLRGQFGQKLGAETKLLNRVRPVSIDHNVSLGDKLLKSLAPLWGFQIKLSSMLAHVAINLEKGHITQARAGDLENIGTVLSQDSRDYRSSDNSAQLEHLDAR